MKYDNDRFGSFSWVWVKSKLPFLLFFLFYFWNDKRHLSWFGKSATGKDEVFEQEWIWKSAARCRLGHLNKNAAGCGWGISIGIDLNECHRVGMDWKVDSSGGGTEKDVKIFREGIQNIATGVRETKKGCGQHIWTRFQKIAIGNRGTKRVGSRQWDNGSKKCCRCKGTKEGCSWYVRTKHSKEQGTWISVTCHSRAVPGPKCCMPG